MTSQSGEYDHAPADRSEHLPVVAKLLSDAFAGGEHVEEITRKYLGDCHYDWGTSQFIWQGDELVHHWGVWDYPMRVGSIRLRTAGVGAVVTKEAHRKRGLMHRAAGASFDAMSANGYHLSVLRGRHYAKYGYVRGWNYVTYRIAPDEIEAAVDVPSYALLEPDEQDAINRLYNKAHRQLSGTAVRPTYPMLDADDMQVYGWRDGKGVLEGYVRAVPDGEHHALRCLEATGDAESCLAVLADLMDQQGHASLQLFTLHHDHPLGQAVRRRACVIEDRYFKHSGWQVRMVNLHACLKTLTPEFEHRLKKSHLSTWEGTFHLLGAGEQAALSIRQGQVRVADDSEEVHALQAGHALARFMIGSDDPREIIRQEGVACQGEGAELADVLFPNLHPMLSHWDEF